MYEDRSKACERMPRADTLEGCAAGPRHRTGAAPAGARAALREARCPAGATTSGEALAPGPRAARQQLEHERHLKAINEAADQLEHLAEGSRGGKVSRNAVKVSAAAARAARAEAGRRAYEEEQRRRTEEPTAPSTTRSARASPTTRSCTATRAASPTRSGASARSRASTSWRNSDPLYRHWPDDSRWPGRGRTRSAPPQQRNGPHEAGRFSPTRSLTRLLLALLAESGVVTFSPVREREHGR